MQFSISNPHLRGTAGAYERAWRLLRAHLTLDQCRSLNQTRRFFVTGGDTGRTYTIHYGNVMNISFIDESGRSRVMCFTPLVKNLPLGDVLLAQKLALECNESETVRIANISL